MSENYNQHSKTARLLHLATHASVATAALLIGAKLVAWLLTGSVSVLASLIDSMMDIAASLINLFAVRYSLMPPDAEHRFGHGKAESLAGLAQATFIAGSALFLILQAIDRLIHPVPLQELGIGMSVIAFAILATLVLLSIQRYVIKRTGSTAIKADSLHYATDLLTNAGTLAALALAGLGWSGLDPVFAMGVAVYILHSAWKIGHEAFHLLMDRELPEAQRQTIRQLALQQQGVLGIHDIRTRRSGQIDIIQLHIELDGGLPLRTAHAIADDVDAALHAEFPSADIIIHQDPVDLPAAG